MSSGLQINESQFMALKPREQMCLLFRNTEEIKSSLLHINTVNKALKRRIHMMWVGLGAITSGLGWLFLKLWEHMQV
jgi:hypothetical protein